MYRAWPVAWPLPSGRLGRQRPRTDRVTATIPVGAGPVEVGTNPLTNTVYVSNFGDDTVSVISG